MSNYSRYVQVVTKDGLPYLYHTLFDQFLSTNSPEEELRKGFYLSGQERESLRYRLFTRENRLKLFYISTWECSLRCPFCFVYKQLQKKDKAKTDPELYKQFLENYWDRYPETPYLEIGYLGGEPMMNIDNCLLIQEVNHDFAKRKGIVLKEAVTTNGTIPIGQKEKTFLDNIFHISVSVDGDAETHNKQRKVYTKELFAEMTPYEKTLRTIKEMVELGYADKLTINSALPDEVHDNKKRLAEHIYILLSLGVKDYSVHLGTIVPTESKKNESEHYKNYLKTGFIFPKPCCVFQYMAFFTVHGNSLYANYFETKASEIGSLSMSIDEIESKFKQHIEETMPILHDDVCSNKCSVVGYCWGGCNNSQAMRSNPSSRCDREKLELKLKDCINNGKIETFVHDYEPIYNRTKVSDILSMI